MTDYARIKEILDDAVQGSTFGAHGPFWRGFTRDQFVAHSVFGFKLIASRADGSFDPDESNLVKALEGRTPFGEDLEPPPPGALFPRMPVGFPPASAAQITEIRDWISNGCPDQSTNAGQWFDPQAGGPLADPTVHNSYWRDFDNWAMFQASQQTSADINTFFGKAGLWIAYANDPGQEPAWEAAINEAAVVEAVSRLEERQRQTVTAHYGQPVPLLTLLDGYERFGDNSLPDDPLRPQDPRHNMNGRSMWFFWTAFSDACLRLAATTAIPAEFWNGMIRVQLVGLMNDGLFRGRFPVNGFPATPQGKANVRTHVRNLNDSALPAEARIRFVDSGIG